jgi:hypothetical protein
VTDEAFLPSWTIPFFKDRFAFLLISRLGRYKVIENDQDAVSDG